MFKSPHPPCFLIDAVERLGPDNTNSFPVYNCNKCAMACGCTVSPVSQVSQLAQVVIKTAIAMWFSCCVRRCSDCVPLRGSSFRSKLYFCSPRSCFNTTFEDKLQTSIFKLVSYAPNRKVVCCRHFGTGSVHMFKGSPNKLVPDCSKVLYHKGKYESPNNFVPDYNKVFYHKGTYESPNKLVPEGNQVLYRFKWTKHLRFISRVKILHVAVVTSLTWPMSYWYFNGIISLYSLTCAITGAAGTTAGLVALSYFFRRVVGELSFDEDTQQVTISSLTFWGNRCNTTFPLTSLVPLSDSGINFKNTFHRLEVNGCSDVYLLNLRHCNIFHEKFFSVTGLPVDEIDLRETGLASRK